MSWSVPCDLIRLLCSQFSSFPFSFIQVHCFMGISRSATIVCAYLIATMRLTPHEALAAVREKRGIVSPNMGFLRQLEEYAIQLRVGLVGKPPAKVGEKVAEAIRLLTRDTTPTRKDHNSRPALIAGVSPSSALPSSKSS